MKNIGKELVFILDRSGSMGGLEQATIDGFNEMLNKQKMKTGCATVTTVLFDDEYELLHDSENLCDVSPLTEKEYFVRGTTALLDAIGKTITMNKRLCKNSAGDCKTSKVLYVIITDGMENASVEYSYPQIEKMILEQKHKGWEFIFLGANMDAVKLAESIGIESNRAVTYKPDQEGIELNYSVVSEVVSSMRCSKPISDSWKDEIERDLEDRDE